MSLPSQLLGLAEVPGRPWVGSRLLARALDLVLPPRCGGCQRVGKLLCPDCHRLVRPVPEPVCHRCGRPQASAILCSTCRLGDFSVQAIRSAAVYTEPLSTAIRQFKYHSRQELGAVLGALMAAYWAGRAVSVDLVVAVPLHVGRLQERGYNQAHLLAQAFCGQAILPLLAEGVIHRTRNTPQQARLDLAGRRRNMEQAFAWSGPALGGAKILLIDDVTTSGSTLEACGQALQEGGAGRVWALTVARALSPGDSSFGRG